MNRNPIAFQNMGEAREWIRQNAQLARSLSVYVRDTRCTVGQPWIEVLSDTQERKTA